MDVLARLATEPPDTSGLPAELAGLVTACMERVPRARPTSSAILAQLGQFTSQVSGGCPAQEHAYLPEPGDGPDRGLPAQSPVRHVAPAHEAYSEEPTSASFTELPAAYKPPARRKAWPRAGHVQEHPADAGSGWRQWLRAHLAWVGWTAVGAALLVAGVILGASLSSSGSPPPGGSPPPPPSSACGPSGPVRAPGQPGNAPLVCMVQASGDPDTTFVVHGTGFAPGVPVKVVMTGVGPPPAQANIMDSTSHDQAGDQPGRDAQLHRQPAFSRSVPARAFHDRGDRAAWRQGHHAVRVILNRRRLRADDQVS